MDSQSQAVDRAIAELHERRVFKRGAQSIVVDHLLPVSSWRPLKADWWRKKEACLIGEDQLGNPILRVCDGTVRLWDREKEDDEILASSVRGFLLGLVIPE